MYLAATASTNFGISVESMCPLVCTSLRCPPDDSSARRVAFQSSLPRYPVQREYRQVVSGGRLIWRSASLNPPYVKVLAAHGFECHCVHRITDKEYNGCIDRVNMYASFWYADRK